MSKPDSICFLVSLVALLLVCATALPQEAVKRPVDEMTANRMREAINRAQHGDTHQALSITAEVVKEHPAFVPALKLRGMLLEDSGEQAAAAECYRAALKAAPRDGEMLVKLE